MPIMEVTIKRENQDAIKNSEAAIRRAAMRAGSDALAAARAEAVRRIRDKINVKAKNIRDAITLRTPRGSATTARVLSWALVVASKPLPVAAYPYRQNRQGVRAQIKAQGFSLIRHAFEATVAAGKTGTHRGVWRRFGPYRLTTKGRYAGTGIKRQAIKELYTTKVLDIFKDAEFLDALKVKALAVFRHAFLRNLEIKPTAEVPFKPEGGW